MATSAVPVTGVDSAGVEAEAFASVTADMAVPSNDGLVRAELQNPTGSDLTFTVVRSATVGGRTIEPDEYVVPAGADSFWIGPFPPALYSQADGTVLMGGDAGLLVRGLRI